MRFATNKLLPLLLCLLFFNSFSQNEFATYTKSNGLTSSTILVTKADSKGIVWVGTANGLNAYTSKGWVPIKSISNEKGYKENIGRVIRIFEASNGDIWILSDNGLFIFNGKFWTYFNDSENEGFKVTDIFEDSRGWIWLVYEQRKSLKDISTLGFSMVEGIVQMYNGFQWIKFPADIGGSAAVKVGDPNIYFTSHLEDSKGNIWLTNQDGAYRFDGTDWTRFDKEILPSDICNKVIESSNNNIWIATRHGVAKQEEDLWVKYEDNKGIKGNDIVDIYDDNIDRVWVVSKRDNKFRNLVVFDDGKWKSFTKDNIKLKGDINRIIDLNDLIVVMSKNGLSYYDGKHWTNIIVKNNIDDYNFSDLTLTTDGTLWFAGRKGIYNLSKDGLINDYQPHPGWKVTVIYEDYDGGIWVGTEKNGVFSITKNKRDYNVDSGLSDNYVKEIFQDMGNRIWVVTKSGISILE